MAARINGAQLLHRSVALCVLNDTYREAARLGIEIDGKAVAADGGFDGEWHSTGIGYSVTLDARASTEDLERLRGVVDEVAEVPKAIRAGASVSRCDGVPFAGRCWLEPSSLVSQLKRGIGRAALG